MITLEVVIDVDSGRAMEAARALRDRLLELDVAESVELARETAGRDAGAKSEDDIVTLATVVLTLLPAASAAAIDWLRDYFRRPGASSARIRVELESGASVEAAFDPTTVGDEEIVRLARGLKSVVER